MTAPAGIAVAAALAGREVMRFGRQPARIAAAVGTPVLIWLLLASGFADTLRPGGAASPGYGAFLLPGVMALVTVFASIFSSISTIDDRAEGWLQAALVSPAPRWSIAAGKIVGAAGLAWMQGAVLLLAAPLLGVAWSVPAAAAALAALALTSLAMSAVGLAFAWRSASSAEFHAVMNLLLLPMWMLSSAMFPLEGVAAWLWWPMRLNPLTWCIEAIRAPLSGAPWAGHAAAAAAFATVTVAAAVAVIGGRNPRPG